MVQQGDIDSQHLVPESDRLSPEPLSQYDVVCGSQCGTLHTDKLGSGSKGKCIESNGVWFTPKEFETFGGRQTSKDWKRSIKIQGKSFFHYVNSGELNVHAFNCYCSTCSGNPTTSEDCGPVKLFSPPNRKRRFDDESFISMVPMNKKPVPQSSKEVNNGIDWDSSEILAILNGASNNNISVPSTSNSNTQDQKPNVTNTNISIKPRVVPSSPQLRRGSVIEIGYKKNMMDIADKIICRSKQIEGKLVNLDAMVANLQRDVFSLKALINNSPTVPVEQKQSVATDVDKLLGNVQSDFRSSITDTLNQVLTRPEFSKNTTSEDAGTCVNCNRSAQFKCGRCNKVRYCNEFCQQKDWPVHTKLCEQVSKGKQRKSQNNSGSVKPSNKKSLLGEIDLSKLKADITNCVNSISNSKENISVNDVFDTVIRSVQEREEDEGHTVEDVPVEDIPVDDVPVDDVPVDDVPVEDVPVEEVPIKAEPVNCNTDFVITDFVINPAEFHEENEEADAAIVSENHVDENVDSDNFLNKDDIENGDYIMKENPENFLNEPVQNGADETECDNSNGSDGY